MTPAPLVRASAWAEAVFHVLAHVDVGRVAASCHEPGWVAWAEARFGRAEGRALGEDCRVIARALGSHDALARAQALAWLWTDAAAVRAATRCDLADLADGDVADSAALHALRTLGPAAEVLRAAAELELLLFTELEPVAVDLDAWALSLASVTRAAPEIARCRIALVRPLPRRGRVYDALIMVGAPGVAGAELAHVSWQAAHEATVREVARARGPARSFEDVERRSLGLLRSRARRVGLEDAHDRWFTTLDVASLGPIPDVDDGAQ